MPLVDTAHEAAVDRYRRVLVRGAIEYGSRLARDPAAASKRLTLLTTAQVDLMVDRYAQRLTKQSDRVMRTFTKAAPLPVPPLNAHALAYEREIKRVVLRPLMRNLRSGLNTAVAAAEAIETIDGVPLTTARRERLLNSQVNAQAKKLNGYHRRKLIQTFRAALGVDIGPVLNDATIKPLMDAWRQENIDLIRTVPERLRDDLRGGINQAFADKPFDQQELRRVVAEKGESAGYNLRRITRDQTNKAVGQLTRARHEQLGIEEYEWQTAEDERVRDSHQALNGTTQKWSEPPGVGHPGEDIQCRCVAIPVISEALPAVEEQPDDVDMALPDDSLAAQGATKEVFDNRAQANWRLTSDYRRLPEFAEDPELHRKWATLHGEASSKMRYGKALNEAEKDMMEHLARAAKPRSDDAPLFRGMSWRADQLDDIGDIRVGRDMTWNAPASTSGDLNWASGFIDDRDGRRILFELRGMKGEKMATFNTVETEFTTMPGLKFRVVDVRRAAHDTDFAAEVPLEIVTLRRIATEAI